MSDEAVTISHREYITDILTAPTTTNGLTSFQLQSWYLNPGNRALHPWLCTIASNYTSFRYRKISFTFVSTSATALNSTNTALGLVFGRNQYDSTQPADTSELQLLNSFANHKANPSISWTYDIDVSKTAGAIGTVTQYTTPTALPSNTDSRLYFMNGFFELATIGMQATNVNVGMLYVSYTIDLLRPTYIQGEIGNTNLSAHYQATGAAGVTPLGTARINKGDYIGMTITNTAITFPPEIQTGTYVVTVYWRSGTPVVWVPPVISAANLTALQVWTNDTDSVAISPESGVTAGRTSMSWLLRINAPGLAQGSLIFGVAGTIPTASVACDIFVNQINGLIIS